MTKHSSRHFGDQFSGFVRQSEKFSRSGACIRRNFTPCCTGFEDRSKDRFRIQYFAGDISYFTCLLGKYRNSRQSRNWRIYHHG